MIIKLRTIHFNDIIHRYLFWGSCKCLNVLCESKLYELLSETSQARLFRGKRSMSTFLNEILDFVGHPYGIKLSEMFFLVQVNIQVISFFLININKTFTNWNQWRNLSSTEGSVLLMLNPSKILFNLIRFNRLSTTNTNTTRKQMLLK